MPMRLLENGEHGTLGRIMGQVASKPAVREALSSSSAWI